MQASTGDFEHALACSVAAEACFSCIAAAAAAAGSGGTEKYEVQARGEMQLAVVIEGLRREGMELAVSPPQVLYR
jgi:GTP-binding protein